MIKGLGKKDPNPGVKHSKHMSGPVELNKAFHSSLYSDLIDGPDNAWLGYYSLTKQNKTEHLQMSFANYIDENKPVTFIDPAVINSVFLSKLSVCFSGHLLQEGD